MKKNQWYFVLTERNRFKTHGNETKVGITPLGGLDGAVIHAGKDKAARTALMDPEHSWTEQGAEYRQHR
jgi:hypothetical protein